MERAALTLVFRVVFILFCESAGHLPMGNPTYEKRSLSSLVQEAYDTRDRLTEASAGLWSGFVQLVRALRNGNPAWDVPAYNGALFASRGFDGAELLEKLELRDPEFAKVLVAIGQEQETRRGADFSTLEIAHIGHTYESLLSLRLSLARRALRYDTGRDRYVEAKPDDVEVQEGGLLWQTHQGGRKAGGVYYTPVEIVRHLVERALLPAYERHLTRVEEIAKTDPEEAARHLLSFAVVDPACGSAHFLVQVAETLAERTVRFLADHPLPAIAQALERLRSGATAGVDIDDVSLLRRLLVKNCVFGVDISPMGAEVATLSLWLASFVPGLSLSYLGRNIRVGNSLIGVADPASVVPEGTLFTEAIRNSMQEAIRLVRQGTEIDDRTPEEVEQSRRADLEATHATKGLARLFDLWTAEQFGLEGAREHVELNGEAVLRGTDVARNVDTSGGDKRVATKARELRQKAQELAGKHAFLHWPLVFPQVFDRERPGFDVVVGNPPWEEVTIEELSFYGMYRPGISSMTEDERDEMIRRLVRDRPDLPEVLRERQVNLKAMREALAAGDYERSMGDPDLYKYFCQRYRALARDRGFLGIVLPRTVFNAKGSQGFREWLYMRSTTHRIDFLLNRGRWIFDTHPQYSIALVVAERKCPDAGYRIEVAGTATTPEEWVRQAETEGVRLTKMVFGPIGEAPLLRSQAEADVLSKMRVGNLFPFGPGSPGNHSTPTPEKTPNSGAASRSPNSTKPTTGSSGAFSVRELDETNDRRLWQEGDARKLGFANKVAPLWKGESFDQYDPNGEGKRICPVTPELLRKARKPRPGAGSILAKNTTVEIRKRAVQTELTRARVAFRDTTNRTNSRTIIACLVPPGVYLTNKAPYLAFIDGDPADQATCLGIMNSLPFDWQARRFVEINVNFFILEGLRLPQLSGDDYRAIARAAARLSAVDERFAEFAKAVDVEHGPLDPAERQRLRIEIDVRVARAWALTVADLRVIFDDFTESAVTPAYRAALVERLTEFGDNPPPKPD